MCYKKQMVFTVCWHTRTVDEDCERQKQLYQLYRKEHIHGKQRQRSWLSLLCMPCFGPEPRPPTPPPLRRECRLEDVLIESDSKCPRCLLLEDQEAAVDRRHRYAYNAYLRKATSSGYQIKGRLSANGRSAEHLTMTPRSGQGKSPPGFRSRHEVVANSTSLQVPEKTYQPYRPDADRGTNYAALRRSRPPSRDFVPYSDHQAAEESPALKSRDSTSHLRPAPLQVSNTKQNKDPSLRKKGTQKPSRSAIAGLQNAPLSALIEDVEKTWSRAPPALSSPWQQPTTMVHVSYTPELPVEELMDEVELMWQIGSGRDDRSR
nr:uncharacterized protein CTRU02_04704 [Colletotrichum truncatum]KAF6795141.1 hypothetical protein CTRU02_04704 [Colletotrichum truncatum]